QAVENQQRSPAPTPMVGDSSAIDRDCPYRITGHQRPSKKALRASNPCRSDAIHLEHNIILAEGVDLLMANSNSSEQPAWQRNPVFELFASLKLAVVLLAVLIIAAIAGTIYESS